MRKREYEALVRKVQARIHYCDTCQPYDGGEVVWILGDRIWLEDLLEEYDIPEKLRDDLCSELRCPDCGRKICRYDDVGELTPAEYLDRTRYERIWMQRERRFGHPLQQFEQLLERFPMLGLQHRLGKKVLKLTGSLKGIRLMNQEWYRCQLLGQQERSTAQRMGPPPLGMQVSEGRFNHQGQPLFYLADNQEGAAFEVLEDRIPDDKVCWVQKFRVTEAAPILSLRRVDYDDDSEDEVALLATALLVSGRHDRLVNRAKGWKPEYLLTRFIADCARYAGYVGIITDSSRHSGDNLVLFRGLDGVLVEGCPVNVTRVPRSIRDKMRVAF